MARAGDDVHAAAAGIAAAMRSASARNFSSRSPTTRSTGMASSPRRSQSGGITPVPSPRSAAASPRAVLRRRSASAASATPARDAREQRLRAPLGHERVEPDRLDPVRERRVGRGARRPLGGVGEARARPHEHQAPHARAERQGGVQRDPAAHRVAGERVRRIGDRAQVGVARGERGGPPLGEGAVPGQVRRDRPVPSRERVADRLPAPARLGEPVEQDEVGGHDATER